MGFMHRAAAAAATLLALAVPTVSRSQVTIRGVLVDDSSGVPVRGAAVMLVDPVTDGPVVRSVSDSLGQFSLVTNPGTYQIAAVKEGFNTTLSAPVPLGDGEGLTIRIPIASKGDVQHRIGVLEHTLGRTQRRTRPQGTAALPGFAARRSLGAGLSFTRKELSSSSSETLADFLRQVPGVRVPSTSVSSSRSNDGSDGVSIRGGTSDGCRVGWYLDGHRMDLRGTPDPFIESLGSMRLDDLEAVEVFRGLSEMPPEFASPELRCGAVALWSRRG
jgi:TonB-dependent Receptor Plug Domain/Carboxypeptidase regulatory-like domain